MTAKTKSERFRRIISHGYFAPELPPCFVSEDLAKFRKYIWDELKTIPPRRGKPAIRTYVSKASSFYFPRFGKDDRRHAIINPISYLAISHTISENYVNLRSVAKQSKISSSPPVFDWSGERSVLRPNIDMRDDFRIDLASRVEEFSVADVRAFFHSIYTHAIPWAIHGKAWAKQNRGFEHYGNLLDLFCRNAQDGQTIGLPVGPDTSRLIAEVVASAIDVELCEKLQISGENASRYVDDYTIGSLGGRNGSSSIAVLRQATAKFELELNNDKSAVHPTSIRLISGWKQAIRSHIPRGNYSNEAFQRFFYEVSRVSNEQPDINVEKFALQNARLSFVNAEDWDRVQSILINSYRRNSSLVSFLAEVLILRNARGRNIGRDKLKVFLENRIPKLAEENRTGEIVWLMFLAIRTNIELRADVIKSVFQMENSLVALLTNFADSRDLIIGDVDYSVWNSFLNEDSLQSPMWLYAYESIRQGINTSGNSDFITNNPFFRPLFSKRVSFLNIDNGFNSVENVLRNRRAENNRAQRVRADFIDDFEFEIEELDDADDLPDFDDEINIY